MNAGADNPARVVIVDDSSTMRMLLKSIMITDGRLDVVGEAADAEEARHIIKQTNPDVVTLDIEMPRMNGLEFLRRIMQLRPMPVVMVSSLTSRGSDEALAAFALGAVDCIWKPSTIDSLDPRVICECVYQASRARPQGWSGERARTESDQGDIAETDQIFLIGASTGGVAALETVLLQMPGNAPPIVIAQHMPNHFLKSFASRLDGMLSHKVAVARDGETIEQGHIRLAPSGGIQTSVRYRSGGWQIGLEEAEGYESFSPSVDHLFFSAVPNADQVVAAILTGIGDDGAGGMRSLRDKGARTIGQDEPSCVVYGMPKAAKAAGAVEWEVDIGNVSRHMMRQVKTHMTGTRHG